MISLLWRVSMCMSFLPKVMTPCQTWREAADPSRIRLIRLFDFSILYSSSSSCPASSFSLYNPHFLPHTDLRPGITYTPKKLPDTVKILSNAILSSPVPLSIPQLAHLSVPSLSFSPALPFRGE